MEQLIWTMDLSWITTPSSSGYALGIGMVIHDKFVVTVVYILCIVHTYSIHNFYMLAGWSHDVCMLCNIYYGEWAKVSI